MNEFGQCAECGGAYMSAERRCIWCPPQTSGTSDSTGLPAPAARAAAEESVPRYRLEQSISNGKPLAEFKLDDDGSWMHATEALPVITALRAQLDTAHAELRLMASSFAEEVVLADEVVSLRNRNGMTPRRRATR